MKRTRPKAEATGPGFGSRWKWETSRRMKIIKPKNATSRNDVTILSARWCPFRTCGRYGRSRRAGTGAVDDGRAPRTGDEHDADENPCARPVERPGRQKQRQHETEDGDDY